MKLYPLLLLLLLVPLVQAADVTVDWGTTTGTVRDGSIAIGTHGVLSQYALIDVNNDGTLDTQSNYTWHRSLWEQIKPDLRIDGYIYERWIGLSQGGFDTWKGTSCFFRQGAGYDANCTEVPYPWARGSGSVNGNATISRTTDAYSGLYALNITPNNGSTSVFISQTINITEAGTFNFSAKVKSPTANAGIQIFVVSLNDSATVCSQGYITYQNVWNTTHCLFNATPIPAGYALRIGVFTGSTRQAIIDDVRLELEPGRRWVGWKSQNNSLATDIRIVTDLVAYQASLGRKTLVILNNIPSGIVNATAECNDSGYYTSCDPVWSEWSDLLYSFTKKITTNWTYNASVEFEIGNEGDLGSYYKNVTDQNRKGVLLGNKYNITKTIVQAIDSRINIIGPATSSMKNPNRAFGQSYINTTGGATTSFSLHTYTNSPTHSDDWLQVSYVNTTTDCAAANNSCEDIRFTEFNLYDQRTKSNQYKDREFSLAYAWALNTDPERIAIYGFEWSDTNNYSTNSHAYPEDYRFVMEPKLDNTITGPFNASVRFATYHPPGSQIVNCTVSNPDVACVAGVNGSRRFVTLINKNETNATVNVSVSNLPGSYYLYDAVSGSLAYPSSGSSWLVTLTNSSVKTYQLVYDDILGPNGCTQVGTTNQLIIIAGIAGVLVFGVWTMLSGNLTTVTVLGASFAVVFMGVALRTVC